MGAFDRVELPEQVVDRPARIPPHREEARREVDPVGGPVLGRVRAEVRRPGGGRVAHEPARPLGEFGAVVVPTT
jgi:hypothetical protein